MNTNPPNPYGGAPDDGAAAFEPRNPYLERALPAQAAPDLDAAAPSLRHSEAQRLNRKALAFLGAIVLLLLLMAAWAVSNATEDDIRKSARTPAEEVRVPELPTAAQAQVAPLPFAPVEPTPVEPYASEQSLPPLPAEQPVYAPSPQSYGDGGMGAPPEPRPLSLMERRMTNVDSNVGQQREAESDQDAYIKAMLAAQNAGSRNAAQATEQGPVGSARPTSARFIQKPDALLVRGTYIRCILETRVISDVPGYTACIVTEPVYSINGRRLLLPRGSKVLGYYKDDPIGARMAVVWDRITTPNGIDVNMQSPGVDGLGGAGIPGERNAHWGSRIASALLISLLSDAFKYAAAEHGPPTRVIIDNNIVEMPFESNTARTVQSLAEDAVDQARSRPATVTINQGTRINVYVARDIDFTAVLVSR